MNTTRKRIVLGAAGALIAAIVAAGGCNLALGIHDLSETGGVPDGGGPCDVDGQCDDVNPCTADSCGAGRCHHATQADGPAPSDAQKAFDCKVVQCTAGQPGTEDDAQDVEADAEDCTVDQCSGGMSFHTAKVDDTPCSMGGAEGTCFGGHCQIACTSDATCNDANPCTQDSCDLAQAVCVFAPLNGVNTPGATQVDHDCRVQVCVDGVDTKSPDDSDLPLTATECDQELCNNGVPSNPPLQLDVACGMSGTRFCDGAGSCVECTGPAQCGADTSCLEFACNAGVCAAVPVAANTHIPAQTPGDCHAVVCDGVGGVKPQPIVDDTDTASDNNDCTLDICTNGAIAHLPQMPGDACGNGQKCNAAIQCGCALDVHCTAPATCGGGNPGVPFTCGCTKTSCAQFGATCGTLPDTCGSTLNCNTGAKDGSETDVDCGGGGTCTSLCGQGKHCSADTDCGSGHCADGVCCNTACNGACVACTAAKKGGGADGVCGSVPAYQPDNAPANICVSPKACDGASQCKKTNGQSCGINGECVSGACADGVCCGAPCGGLCQACSAAKKGGGVDGVCGNIAVNQADTSGAQTCTGINACDGGGQCKLASGQPCTLANPAACATGVCTLGLVCQ